MPKATGLLDEIDSAVAATAVSLKPRTWFDALPEDAKATLLAAREKFHAGGYNIPKYSLASVLIDYAEKRNWRICSRKGVAEWLAQS
ncbi:MAG: hypothetical protein EBR82_30130 [Caulobacteraceae bacterium]|nr:hypothetical protein [Caulobacteraceae bacterium]